MEGGYIMAKAKSEPNVTDEGDQIPNPRKPELQNLIERIPGTTKFEKFQFMRGMAYTELQICKSLNIKSHAAFHMMDQKADDIVSNYLRYQAKTGHLQNLATALKISWNNVYALERAAKDAEELRKKHPTETKYYYPENHFRQTLAAALKDVVELQKNEPLAAAFDLFIKDNIIEADHSRKKSGAPGGLALFPKDLKN